MEIAAQSPALSDDGMSLGMLGAQEILEEEPICSSQLGQVPICSSLPHAHMIGDATDAQFQ